MNNINNDLISRQQAIDEAEKWFFNLKDKRTIGEVLKGLPSEQPETNCSEFPNNSDTISRQAAIDKITKRLFETAFNNVGIKQNIDETLVDVAENRLENWFDELPSIQSERKTGRWIQLTCDSAEWWYCSECNGRVQMNPWVKYNYCPNCGTDMRSEQNE